MIMTSFKRLLSYAAPFRRHLTTASMYSVLNKTFDVVPEVLIGVAVDVIVRRENSFMARMGIEDVLSQLIVLGIVTLIVFACESILQFAFQVSWRNLAQSLQHAMRLDAYAHVQRLDMAYFDSKSTGTLLSIINDDINQLERFLDGGANALIQVMAGSLIVGTIFFVISPTLALFALLPLPVIVVVAYYFQSRLGPRYNAVRHRAGLINERLSNNMLGMATIRSYGKEAFEQERLTKDSQAYLHANHGAIRFSSAFIPVVRMAIVAGFIATLIVGGYFALQGKIEVASYSVLVFLTQRLLWPFTRLAEMTDLYQRAMASANRVMDLLDTPVQISDGAHTLPQAQGDIEFVNVSFSYKAGQPIFENFSVRIPKGETVAFVGHTGAGKSTLLKLLMRFYAPVSGKILLDGHDIAQLKLADLRRAISFVSQDVYLFPGTIFENIAYGLPHIAAEEVIKAAKQAYAHEFISRLPEGYSTQVGERGLKLSGGQKQRISIARAVLKMSPIFIFDEATSSVDNETEEAIQRSLREIVQERTTIIIAHRLSTIRNAHHIHVLDHGRIVESGRHEELIQGNGLYAKLWKIQTGTIV